MDALQVIRSIRNGEFAEEVTHQLEVVAQETVRTGRPGRLTISIETTTRAAGDEWVNFAGVLASRMPKRAPATAYAFVLDGSIHKSDPRQQEMDFRVVGGEAEIREAAADERQVREAR